jgi:heme-degrading monooxygenase HmoA
MYVQINTTRVKEAHVEDFVEAISAEKLGSVMRGASGHLSSYLIQSVDDLQIFASLSLWETRAEGETFFTNPDYSALVGGVRELLAAGLDRQGYVVRVEY